MKIGKLEIKLAEIKMDTQEKALTPVVFVSYKSKGLSISIGWWHFKLGVTCKWG